jgi:F-type H+-transporting ATPase subunit c
MRTMRLMALVVAALFVTALPAFAQTAPSSATLSGAGMAAGIGVGMSILGAGWGFGRIGAAALESMARQPEVAARIQTAAIIIGALLEGATFFGLLVCIILGNKATF